MATPLESWVDDAARLTKPDRVVYCDGSETENERIAAEMLRQGDSEALNEKTYPKCYLHRSSANDVARTEHLTFICMPTKDDVGPTNNWMDPEAAKRKAGAILEGAMRGRTMYVVPYIMGPVDSPLSKAGVEATDSPYVVASMRIMSRMGKAAERIGGSADFVPGLHSTGDLDPLRRYIMHFPQEKLIWSVGSGYGGNALLGKKCFALRIASYMARQQGWMAEHMLVLGLESPGGKVTYMGAAFPSACGKTNLAMMVSALQDEGYRVWTVGDDIAWMKIGEDGYLHAINPEAGFFGVAPGTGWNTNPNVMNALRKNTLFTNVAMTPEREPWWEGIGTAPPAGLINWKGEAWDSSKGPAAHPNARYTVPAKQSPSISPKWEAPEGVPISAFIFGGRRARLAPLVYESFDWQHGVFVGATMASETTAAATGNVGVVRRDPMAMLPFCGYNMADYFQHWLEMGKRIPHPPKIFHVNWFRRGADGKFLWPGFGENVRVLKWILERVEGRGGAQETQIGYVPAENALTLDRLQMSRQTLQELLRVDSEDWEQELGDIGEFFNKFGRRLPQEMREEQQNLSRRLSPVAGAAR